MSVSRILSLDTPVTPDELRELLIKGYGFEASETWRTQDGTPLLISDRGVVLVQPPDPDIGGPYEYPQSKTVEVTLDPNKQPGAHDFLFRLAGDILQYCPGDAALEPDTGGTDLLRRGDTVWVSPDPYTREHLFSGKFRPNKLIVGLPSRTQIIARQSEAMPQD